MCNRSVNSSSRTQEDSNVRDLISQFDYYLRTYKDLASSTIKDHHVYLDRFFDWFNKLSPPVSLYELDPVVLRRFLDNYCSSYTPASFRKLRFSLRAFFKFCHLYGIMKNYLAPLLPQKRVPSRNYVPIVLKNRDIENLIKISKADLSQKGKRDYAMLLLLICYGVRGIQVRRLKLNDINWENNLIYFPAVKNGNKVKQPILPEAGNALIDYIINIRPATNREDVFLSIKPPNKPLSNSAGLSSIISKLFDKCNIKIPCNSLRGSHLFRHTFASRLLSSGEPIKNISDMLGHKYYDTTMIYTKIDIMNLKKACLEWKGN